MNKLGVLFVEELDAALHVATEDVLRNLVQSARLAHDQVAGRQIYCTADPMRRRQQILAR